MFGLTTVTVAGLCEATRYIAGYLYCRAIWIEVRTQEAYTGEIIQERRSFKPTFEAVTSPPAQLYGAYDRYYSSNLYFQ